MKQNVVILNLILGGLILNANVLYARFAFSPDFPLISDEKLKHVLALLILGISLILMEILFAFYETFNVISRWNRVIGIFIFFVNYIFCFGINCDFFFSFMGKESKEILSDVIFAISAGVILCMPLKKSVSQ